LCLVPHKMGRTGGLLDDPSGKGKARPRIWRRRLTRIVSLGMVVYAANALLGLAGWGAERAPSSSARISDLGGDPNCVRGGVQCDARPARPTTDAVALRLPDPDPTSGKSRYYSANHWFHVSEFHARNHARLKSMDALPPLHEGNGVVIALAADAWKAQLRPMTRLLLAATYTDGRASRVSFALPSSVVHHNRDGTRWGPGLDGTTGLACGWTQSSWHVTPHQPLRDRFVRCAGWGGVGAGCEPSSATLATDGGGAVTFGAVKSERGDWFPTSRDVTSLRDTIDRLCDANEPEGGDGVGAAGLNHDESVTRGLLVSNTKEDSSVKDKADRLAGELEGAACMGGGGSTTFRHVVIYQRDTGRRLEGAEDVAQRLIEALPGGTGTWRHSVVTHHEALPPCLLKRCLGNADVLVTPHGFQSMLYLLLKPGSLMYEVFPHRYYKHGYKRAALEWDLVHGMSLSPPRGVLPGVISRTFTTGGCMSMYYCRYFARKGDVVLEGRDVEAIARAVKASDRDGEGAALDPSRGSIRWITDPGGAVGRTECLAACAGNHSCQRFKLVGQNDGDDSSQARLETGGTCMLRVDSEQGERDGDVIGAGIYNNKCWVPGC